jgi:hypothetical protein
VGKGDGVTHAVLEVALKKMLGEDAYWRVNLEEDYLTLAPRIETSNSCCSQIKAYGMLVMITICHGVSPDPVLPFLLAILLGSEDLLCDLDFIKTIAPVTGSKLEDWMNDKQPPPNTEKNRTLLMNLLIEVRRLLPLPSLLHFAGPQQYRDITDYNAEQSARLRKNVFTKTLLGKLAPEELQAFGEGLQICLTNTVPNVGKVCTPVAINIFTHCNHYHSPSRIQPGLFSRDYILVASLTPSKL